MRRSAWVVRLLPRCLKLHCGERTSTDRRRALNQCVSVRFLCDLCALCVRPNIGRDVSRKGREGRKERVERIESWSAQLPSRDQVVGALERTKLCSVRNMFMSRPHQVEGTRAQGWKVRNEIARAKPRRVGPTVCGLTDRGALCRSGRCG